jgi:arylsulfatase A-like enzyme
MGGGRPNIVFVFPDQLRQQAVGFVDEDPVLTPNLDRFARQSVVFTNAVSNRPVSSPYRAMLFTGRYPHSNGVLSNCNSLTRPYGCELRKTDRCLSDVLAEAGYCQGYVGKLHLDSPREEDYPHTEGPRSDGVAWDAYTPPGPRRHGFDFWCSYGCCDRHLDPHYWTGDAPVSERVRPREWSVKHETDVAVRYIRNEGGEFRGPGAPFSLFVAYNPPHTPFEQVPEKYLEPYAGRAPEELLVRPNVDPEAGGPGGEAGRKAYARAARHVARYFAAVTGIDEQFGRILDALDREGLADDTIVVFTSDHGEMMGSHGLMHKVVWYDESLLVPFAIRWPGKIRPGRDDLLLGAPDVCPTLLGLAGLAERTPPQVEGTDYSAALLGGEVERPASALYLRAENADPAGGARGLRTHGHTFVVERDAHGRETTRLYDNDADRFQQTDSAGESPGLVARLREELDSWLRRTKDPWLARRGAG